MSAHTARYLPAGGWKKFFKIDNNIKPAAVMYGVNTNAQPRRPK